MSSHDSSSHEVPTSPEVSPRYNRVFSHIYVEEGAKEHPRTRRILERFPKAHVIPITNYKEVFNRHNQTFQFQKQSRQLILAKRANEFFYPGSGFAPDFQHRHFFYNTLVLNCLYDCEYCYLQGMFPSAHVVAFVNNEEFMGAIAEQLVKTPSLYLCLSYDTDLLASEDIFGYVAEWIDFAKGHPGLTLELRTKSVAIQSLLQHSPTPQMVLAWTLSPTSIAKMYERGAPSTGARLKAIQAVSAHGWPVRICLDPIIPVENWREEYHDLLSEIAATLEPAQITEMSLGTFRLNSGYFKQMKKHRPDSRLLHQRYEDNEGVVSLPKAEEEAVLVEVATMARELFPSEKIHSHYAPASVASEIR